MDARIKALESSQLKTDRPEFRIGDTVKVFVRILEEEKTRIQPFEGVVISRKNSSIREMFTVRRISYGEGVERSFLLHSPFIEKILVVKRGNIRRAKLYYLRKKVGKGARIQERYEESSQESAPPAPPASQPAAAAHPAT